MNSDLDLLPIRGAEFYAELPICVSNRYKLLKSGALPAVKLGKLTFVRRGDLRKLKENLPAYGNAGSAGLGDANGAKVSDPATIAERDASRGAA